MNLTELSKMAIKEHELPDSAKNQRAVRQKLQRILEEMSEAEKWHGRSGKKGDWDIPPDAASRILDGQEFLRYVAKRRGHEHRALLEAAERKAEKAAAAWRDEMEERLAKTAEDAQNDYEPDPFFPSNEQVKEEETRLLLVGIVGLIASSEGKSFDFGGFQEAHSRLIAIRAENARIFEEDHDPNPTGEMAQIYQEKKLSDLRNFFS